MRTRWPILVSAVVMVLAIACGGGESTTPTEQSSTVEVPTATEVPSEAPTATDVASDALGTLEVRVTDQPGAEVSAIVLTVQNIEVSTSDGAESGWQTVLEGPFEFDLLQLDGIEEILGSAMLEVGRYQQIRLEIVSAQVTIPNGVRSAAVPSDKLRLVGGFEVVESETTIVTLDFDAQRSVIFVPQRGPQLMPVVKLLVRNEGQSLEDASGASSANGPAETTGMTVSTDIAGFKLEDLVIPVGTEVTWVNQDSASHTTTSGTPAELSDIWNSDFLDKGDSFSRVFLEPGVYPYFCRIHSSMTATITVMQPRR